MKISAMECMRSSGMAEVIKKVNAAVTFSVSHRSNKQLQKEALL